MSGLITVCNNTSEAECLLCFHITHDLNSTGNLGMLFNTFLEKRLRFYF